MNWPDCRLGGGGGGEERQSESGVTKQVIGHFL